MSEPNQESLNQSAENLAIRRDVKDKITSSLFEAVSVCGICHRQECAHHDYRTLPAIIPVSVVLHAINAA